MADEIVIVLKAGTASFRREVKSALDVGSAQVRQFKSALDSSASSVISLRNSLGGLKTAFAALGGAFVLKQIAEAAIQSAINIDKSRQALIALTGSAEAANKKLAELRKLAAASPGVTTSFATELFTQLKALNEIAEPTINKLIQSIGKLNAVFTIPDARVFAQNLTQIFKGGFEISDIKEARQAVPIFDQILKQAFGTNNPEALRKLQQAGKLTLETFLGGIADAIATDPRFKDIQESIGARIAKAKDNLLTALAPVGEELAKILLPVLNDVVKKVEEFGSSAARVFAENRNDIIATAKEVTQLVVEVGKLIGKVAELGAKSGVFRLLAVGSAVLRDIAEDPLQINPFAKGPNVRAVEAKFDELEREQQAVASSPFLSSVVRDLGTGKGVTPPSKNPPTSPGGGAGRARTPVDLFSGRGIDIREQGERLLRQRAELDRAEEEHTKLLVDEFRDRNERLREQRASRVQQTREFGQQEIDTLLRGGRRDLTRSGRFIGDAISRGQITGGEADLLGQASNAEFANKLRNALALEEKMAKVNQENVENLKEEIALYDQLSVAVSDTERFMRGFNSQIETSGDAFDRFGQNVARAFGNVRDLFNGLKQAVLGFFNDLVGSSLQNLVRGVLGPIFGGGGRGGGGGGIGGFFQQAFAGGGGGGISAPPSVSSGGIGGRIGGLTGIFGGGGGGGTIAASGGGGFGGFSLGGLGGSLAAAAPLLGLGLGAGLGGSSILGQIAGGIGGAAIGIGASFGASVFGAGGGLAAAGLAALGPIALIGAPLIVGAILLGKVAQRRKDEEASGQFLTQALQGIQQLAAGVASGQVDGSQARGIFDSQILATFRQQIGGLKTKSVRESRLTNQVRDLERNYNDVVGAAIVAQQARQLTASENALNFSRQIPEFAGGGIHSRGGLAVLHPREMVLTPGHQSAIAARAGSDIFRSVGVPGVQHGRTFDQGGIMPAGQGQGPIVIENLTVSLLVGKGDATRIVVEGGTTAQGRAVTVNNVKVARTNREL